jgi:hypothetical protein
MFQPVYPAAPSGKIQQDDKYSHDALYIFSTKLSFLFKDSPANCLGDKFADGSPIIRVGSPIRWPLDKNGALVADEKGNNASWQQITKLAETGDGIYFQVSNSSNWYFARQKDEQVYIHLAHAADEKKPDIRKGFR